MQHQYRKIQHILRESFRNGLSYTPENLTPDDFPYDPARVQSWKMIHEPAEVRKYLMHATQ
jgi:hypothetical protein